MPVQFPYLNEVAASRAVDLVHRTTPAQDPEAIANGARVTSEVMLRALGKSGIDIPEDFAKVLANEFTAATIIDANNLRVHRRRIAEMESGGA